MFDIRKLLMKGVSCKISSLLRRFHLCRQGDDGSVGPIGSVGDGRMHEAISHTCLSSSVEYELALILKELRWITDQVRSSVNMNANR